MSRNENSVDLAKRQLRELQAMIFDRATSPDDLFKKTQEMDRYLDDAAKEINTNYDEISSKLTNLMNTGRPD